MLSLLLWTAVSWGADLLVGPTQTYTTSGSAYIAAASGDRVLVDPGTYTEYLTLNLHKSVE